MPWTGKVELDTDKPDVGIVTAVWNLGLADEFTYSRRGKMNNTDKNSFVLEAKAALIAQQAKVVAETNFTTILTTALNV